MSRKVSLIDVNSDVMQVLVKLPKQVVEVMPSKEYFNFMQEFIDLSERLLDASERYKKEYDDAVLEANLNLEGNTHEASPEASPEAKKRK